MLENAKRKIEIEVKAACEKLLESKTSDEMLYYYFGTSCVIDYALSIDILTIEEHEKYGNILDKAHDEYYEKAKKDLESAHKRLF